MLLAASTQATPEAQHCRPHGVAPLGQQQPPEEQVSPFWQQKAPQAGAPDGHPHFPVEALTQTFVGPQHVDPQTAPSQHVCPAQRVNPGQQVDPQHLYPAPALHVVAPPQQIRSLLCTQVVPQHLLPDGHAVPLQHTEVLLRQVVPQQLVPDGQTTPLQHVPAGMHVPSQHSSPEPHTVVPPQQVSSGTHVPLQQTVPSP